MAAKAIKPLELHHTMIQFLISDNYALFYIINTMKSNSKFQSIEEILNIKNVWRFDSVAQSKNFALQTSLDFHWIDGSCHETGLLRLCVRWRFH